MADDDFLGLYRTDLIESKQLLQLAKELIVRAKTTHLHSWDEGAEATDAAFAEACSDAMDAVRYAINAIDDVEMKRIKIYKERKNERENLRG